MTLVDDANLNDCGCCAGISKETPLEVFNRPGLSAIAYRIGTHADFKETMVAQLSGAKEPALLDLTTRAQDDFTLALLDAWSTVGDVLTFYQERIANEAYLRTATERLSVLELARLIDYQLRPGVAASTYLAFTLEAAPGALGQALAPITTSQNPAASLPPITIGVGTKVQSVPGPGEQAQTFETLEKLEARVEWNAMRPRPTQPQKISEIKDTLFIAGRGANLKQGDRLLVFVNPTTWALKTIFKLTVDDKADTTRVDFATKPGRLLDYVRPTGLSTGSIKEFSKKVPLSESTKLQIMSHSWKSQDLLLVARMQGWDPNTLVTNPEAHTSSQSLLTEAGVFAFHHQAQIFGHNAPHYRDLKKSDETPIYPNDWDRGIEIWRDTMNPPVKPAEPVVPEYYSVFDIFLDRPFPKILKDSWVVLESPASQKPELFIIHDVKEASTTGFGITVKTTGLKLVKPGETTLPNSEKKPEFLVQNTTALVESEQLILSEVPITEPLAPASVVAQGITLDGPYQYLKPGQRVILSGERTTGEVGTETFILKEVAQEGRFTVITFTQAPLYSYVRESVVICGNIALATHGETVSETLGGGDATQEFQRFVLKQPPITYVQAANSSGALSTLEIRVNDILWHEVRSFVGHGPGDRIYITRLDDDGKTTVIFGNGVTGSRLPTGQENVKATYRKGIGVAGLVRAHQLTQLMTRPLGVKGVTNPNAANGGADAEKLSEARRNAPLSVLTLGRIVSLQDYQDFARAFSGIEKALVTPVQIGEKNGAFLTIAGADGAEVANDSSLYFSLLTAIKEAGDPTVPVLLKSYQERFFRLSAKVIIDPDFLPEKVLAVVEQQLRESFSFSARDFGQPVHLSEVIALIQSVIGVVTVNVTEFYRAEEDPSLHLHLIATVPNPGAEELLPAEILMLDPIQPLKLEVLT